MYTFLIIMMLAPSVALFTLYRKIAAKKKNKAVELKMAYNYLLTKNRLSIDEVEIFNSKVIGLDKKGGKLILIEYVNSIRQQICISCKELESHRVTRVMDKIEGCISGIVIEFKLRNQKFVCFTFYDSSKDNISAFSFLRDKAKYWDAKIHRYRQSR